MPSLGFYAKSKNDYTHHILRKSRSLRTQFLCDAHKTLSQGDFGAPLICDIDGSAIFIGINSDGAMNECGQAGKPAINLNVIETTDWMNYIIKEYAPPKTCFKPRIHKPNIDRSHSIFE